MRRLLIIAMVMLPAVALARPRVALVAFEGDARGEVQEVVAELLDGDFAVAGPKQVSRTIDKLGLDTEMSDKDLKKLANELDADAIVRGDLSKSGKHKLLHVRLFVNGKKVRGFRVEFASAKSEKFKQALKDKMVEKLSGDDSAPKKKKKVEEPAPDEEEPAGTAKTKKKQKADDTEEATVDTEKKPKKKKAADDEEDDAEDPEGDDEEEEGKRTARVDGESDDDIDGELQDGVTVETASKRTANRAAIRVDIGASASARSLKFNSRPFEEAPKPYSNTPVAGVRVAGDIYPLAFGNPDSFLAGFGVGGHYDKTLSLNLKSTIQAGTEFPVEQKHWSIGGRFRFVFGKKPTSPSVTLSGGYFHRVFKVDRSALMEGNIIDLPDVFYKGYNPGLQLRFPIVESVALIFAGEAMLVTSTGQIQQPYSYGQATVTAGQGMAGVDIIFKKRFAIRIVGEAAQYGFDFAGTGELSNNRDRNPENEDVGGAADRYLGGAASLSVLY